MRTHARRHVRSRTHTHTHTQAPALKHTDYTKLNLHNLKWAANRELQRMKTAQNETASQPGCCIVSINNFSLPQQNPGRLSWWMTSLLSVTLEPKTSSLLTCVIMRAVDRRVKRERWLRYRHACVCVCVNMCVLVRVWVCVGVPAC